jgi:hypothetical protein
LRAGFAYYRTHYAEASLAQARTRAAKRLAMPVLTIGGSGGIRDAPLRPCSRSPRTCRASCSTTAALPAGRASGRLRARGHGVLVVPALRSFEAMPTP